MKKDIIRNQIESYLKTGELIVLKKLKDALVLSIKEGVVAFFVNDEWVIALKEVNYGGKEGDGKRHWKFMAGYKRDRLVKEFLGPQKGLKDNVMHFIEDGCIRDGVDDLTKGGLKADFTKRDILAKIATLEVPSPSELRKIVIKKIWAKYKDMFKGEVLEEPGFNSEKGKWEATMKIAPGYFLW